MTKIEQEEHKQHLINYYNRRLDEIDKKISSVPSPLSNYMLHQSRKQILRRLMVLYDTEKYGLVQD